MMTARPRAGDASKNAVGFERVLMTLSVVDGLKQGYPGRLKEAPEAEPSRVTRPAMW